MDYFVWLNEYSLQISMMSGALATMACFSVCGLANERLKLFPICHPSHIRWNNNAEYCTYQFPDFMTHQGLGLHSLPKKKKKGLGLHLASKRAHSDGLHWSNNLSTLESESELTPHWIPLENWKCCCKYETSTHDDSYEKPVWVSYSVYFYFFSPVNFFSRC